MGSEKTGPRRCCERDTDGDGNCDRHLAGWLDDVATESLPPGIPAREAGLPSGHVAELEAELSATRQTLGEKVIESGKTAETLRARVAELVADNAALLKRAFDLCPGCNGSKTLPILDTKSNEIGRTPCTACEDIRTPHLGASLLEQHAKALIRARNEGVEKARAHVEARCMEYGKTARDAPQERTRAWADENRKLLDRLCVDINGLKEAES